jgi:hypothetical protein
MNNFFYFTVGALATYRLSRLLTRDEILSPARNWLWKRFPPETNKFGYLFTCMWCMSIWSASLLVLSGIIIFKITLYLGLVLSFSAVTGLLAAYEDRN